MGLLHKEAPDFTGMECYWDAPGPRDVVSTDRFNHLLVEAPPGAPPTADVLREWTALQAVPTILHHRKSGLYLDITPATLPPLKDFHFQDISEAARKLPGYVRPFHIRPHHRPLGLSRHKTTLLQGRLPLVLNTTHRVPQLEVMEHRCATACWSSTSILTTSHRTAPATCN